MTDIEVVDINDNNSKEEIKEEIKEELVKEIKEEIKPDVKEDVKPDVKPDVKEDVIEEPIKVEKKKIRKDLKEKTKCPDCGMEMTVHSLKYTHKKYCKAKQITTEAIEINETEPVQDIEEEPTATGCVSKRVQEHPSSVVNTPPSKQPPPGLERAVSRIAEAVPVFREPNDDDIIQYILNKKKAMLTKRKENISLLVSSALPKNK